MANVASNATVALEDVILDSDNNNALILDDFTFVKRLPRLAHSRLLSLSGSNAIIVAKGEDDDKDVTMVPRPDGDLFIEPAGDYDVVYGDFNSTMDDGTGKRSYLRLTAHLPNVTRATGGEVRLKCEVAGSPLPINFAWLKNLAPLERNSRIRIRNKDYWSKLVISNLDVLDSGYYQCTASNQAGVVNSTAVLRVNTLPSLSSAGSTSAGSLSLSSARKSLAKSGSSRPGHTKSGDFDDYYGYESKDYPDELKSSDNSFLMDVPKSAAGSGFAPMTLDRWLENRTLQKGECVLYQGTSCSQFLAGKYVKINTDNREDVYDIDRHLTAAMMFIKNMPNVSDSCKRYSHAVACYHLFKVCNRSAVTSTSYDSSLIAGTSNDVISICRQDCDMIQTNECPNEFAMAAQHELVGDGPKALLPRCDALSPNAQKCIRVLEPATPFQSSFAETDFNDAPSSSSDALCYEGDGRNYEGPVAKTKSQRLCLPWPQHTSTQFNTNVYPRLKNAQNHCRNPDGRRPEPFCYTDPLNLVSGAGLVEEACDIPRCTLSGYRPSTDGFHRPNNEVSRGAPPPLLLDSLAGVWRSLSPEQMQLVVALGVGGIAMLLLLFFCCLCCCCRRRDDHRRKSSVGGSGTAGCGTSSVNAESTSSMISGAKKNNQFVRVSGGGGSSSAGNSDVNNAFFHKMRDDRLRNGCGDTEALNPLLNPSEQFIQQQQQIFELQQQKFRWMGGNGGGGSIAGGGSLPYPYASQQLHHSLPHAAQHLIGGAPPLPPVYTAQQPPPPQHQPFAPPGGNNLSGGSPHTSTEPPSEPYQIPTIREHELHFDEECGLIGEDVSTKLLQGEWSGNLISGNALHVAIKTLKPNASKIAIENFRDEIKELGPFEHINVLRMHGVAYLSQQNISAIFDYMIHGDLHEFLKVREPRATNKNDEEEHLRNEEDFLRICTQIIAGMEYLASFGYVHKDLATRNCLIADQQIVKIADFARLKSPYDNDYYRINHGMKMPLRWMSREAFNEGKYSQASDVHAFGVTLWEIFTYGRQPYDNFTDQQVIDMLSDDLTLESPAFCRPTIYSTIMHCTNSDPKRRPTFAELHPRFQKWCATGLMQAILPGGRASSVHSGSSGSAAMQRTCRQMVPPVGSYTTSSTTNNSCQPTSALLRNGVLSDQPFGFSGSGSVPSPAPNASGGGIAKLTMLSGGATNNIVHSTPIGHKISKPLNGYTYSEDDDYSSNDS